MFASHDSNDIQHLGFGGTAMPAYSLNLAGVDGFPTPEEVMNPALDDYTLDDYTKPDTTVPALVWDDGASGDSCTAARFVPEFATDPTLPDVKAGPMPDAVDVQDGIAPNPVIASAVPDAEEINASL